MRWTPSDEVLLRLFGKAVEAAFSVVPDEIRLHPRALAAYRRASGRDAADAPLVEAPFFTDPPKDRKGMPMHYAPRRKLPFPMPPVPTPPTPKALVERAGSLVHTTFSLAGLRPARGRRRPAA